MHAITILAPLVFALLVLAWGYYSYEALLSIARFSKASYERLEQMSHTLMFSRQEMIMTRESIDALAPHVVAIRAAIESVVRLERTTVHALHAETPQRTAVEPLVPTPHGEPKTLLLMNDDRTVAHRVTYHRDVPSTYAYGGRVFQFDANTSPNDEGAFEFIPC